MNCPECGKRSKIIDVRKRDDGKYGYIPEGVTHRRRECVCGNRFVSYELLEIDYRRLKGQGTMEAFIKIRDMAEDVVDKETKKIFEMA